MHWAMIQSDVKFLERFTALCGSVAWVTKNSYSCGKFPVESEPQKNKALREGTREEAKSVSLLWNWRRHEGEH